MKLDKYDFDKCINQIGQMNMAIWTKHFQLGQKRGSDPPLPSPIPYLVRLTE